MTVPSVICNSPDGNATSRVILRLDNGDLFHIPYLAAIAEPVPAVPGSSATPLARYRHHDQQAFR